MIMHKVTLIPGEGIGPEVAAATRRILEASGVQIDWEEIAGRSDSSSDQGKTVNQAAVDSVRRNRVALKGPMATAIAGGAPSVNVALRKTLDLYANLRPVKNMPGVKLIIISLGLRSRAHPRSYQQLHYTRTFIRRCNPTFLL